MNKEEAKESLLALKQELSTRLQAVDEELHQKRSQDFAEQATEAENHDVLMSLKLEAEHELSQIQLALRKMEEGTYGQCQHCGENITQARLDALPLASSCIECAE